MCDTITRHSLCRGVCFTSGVGEYRDDHNCHWLIDIVATRQGSKGVRAGDMRFRSLQIWRLRPIQPSDKPVDFDGGPAPDAMAVVEAGADIDNDGEMIDVQDRQFVGFTDWDFEQGWPKFYVAPTQIGDEKVQLIFLPREY